VDFKWDQSLATGNYVIDWQHQELFRRMDRLATAISREKGIGEVSDAIAFFEEYATQHFRAEEKMQQVNSFPDFDSHRRQHSEILKNIILLKSELQMDGPTVELAVKSMTALGNWIYGHINVLDRKFANYLREQSQISLTKLP
jgi:hemerythrin